LGQLLAGVARAGATTPRTTITVDVSGGTISSVYGPSNDLVPKAAGALTGRSVGGSVTCKGASAPWTPP
jgi:hypothetical protein